MPSCRYCGGPLHHGLAQVCRKAKCQKRRRSENAKRDHARRKAKGIKREPENHSKPTNGKTEVICECGRRFKTALTWDNLPQFTRCYECRRNWQELEAGAMF